MTDTSETTTILFTDLEGSTDLRTRVGDALAHEVIRTHENLIRSLVSAVGGVEAKALGDGFMILFQSARQALACAVSIQRAIEEHNRKEPSKAFKVRIGINTGEVTRERGDVYGAAVNAGARVCAKAQGGQILISQLVKDLAEFTPDVRVVDRGLYWLKGFPQRWRLFEVLWRDRAQSDEPVEPVRTTRVRTDVAELPRAQGPIVGRSVELDAITSEIERSLTGCLRILAIEGEAGIGKTRLLEEAAENASSKGFALLQVSADEDLRGPFFLFRALFQTASAESIAQEASALEALDRAREALSGRDDHHEGLTPQEQMLHVFDEVTVAVRSLAQERPLALLLDDLQWADEDSLRLLRYLARTVASSSIFMLFTIRAATDASAGSVMHLVADLDRMHLCKRVRLPRFTRAESGELLQNLLGAPVSSQALGPLHSRAEGVPFFIEEFARAYRQTRVLQLIGGTWTMTQLSGPAVPASVASLIDRRLAQLEGDVRDVLADAAVLGKRFRVSDLSHVASSIGDRQLEPLEIEEMFETAVAIGLIAQLPEDVPHDYVFTHEQIRATLDRSQSRQRRRRIHAAIAEQLAGQGDDVANLTALAHHALRGGDDKLGVSCSIKAARKTLESHAPEESVRIVDAARASAATPEDRAELLRLKDQALEVLERGEERAANLAEMAALASAVGDPLFEMEVKLRRAATARMINDFDQAIELASQVRQAAIEQAQPSLELQACLELGQALIRSTLGESFTPLTEVAIEPAEEPFERAAELARELGDRPILAAVMRELGVLHIGRAKHRAIDVMDTGARLMALFFDEEIKSHFTRAQEPITEALRIYEDLGDQRGAMGCLITLAYAHLTDFTRRGEAGRLEQIRRLRTNLKRMTTESERAVDEAHMLYSIHTFARSHLILDLALDRGREGYEAARAIGDRWLEFLCAGGLALTHLLLRETAEASAWLANAGSAALATPGPMIARRLESWRGLYAAQAEDPMSAIEHFERAIDLAVENRSIAGRCEGLALLAMEAAKLGEATGSDELLERAGWAAVEARKVASGLSEVAGQLAWEAQAWAASALVAQQKGDNAAATECAKSALVALSPRLMRAFHLDVYRIAGRILIGGGAPEADDLKASISEMLFKLDNSLVDPAVKERWVKVPINKELIDLAGYEGFTSEPGIGAAPAAELEEIEIEILRQLASGKNDAEIANELDTDEEDVDHWFGSIFSKLHVDSKEEVTEYALTRGIV